MTTINLSVLIAIIFINSFASCELISDDVTLITEYGSHEKQCTTELAIKLDTEKHNLDGETGADGDKGSKGNDGINGLDGAPGKNGRDGINGINGADGAPGRRGETGDRGPTGPPGTPGVIGTIKGLRGPQGDTGDPGAPGKCDCDADGDLPVYEDYEYDDKDEEVNKEWGKTKDKPGMETCRNAPIGKSGIYYIYKNPINVTCDYVSKKTCVAYSSDKVIEYRQSEPFWLSQKNVTLKDIYNLDSAQLAWLQRESFTANLTIRYHCKNSNPHNVTLLSWNDKKIGRYSTNNTSFHYYMPIETDKCSSANKTEWSSTDIILITPIVKRLPIIDFFITDVRNEFQALRIEIVQLCFG